MIMPIHRRRFRIEEAFVGDVPMPSVDDGGEVGPMHREIMTELRAIRAQMATPGRAAAISAEAAPSPQQEIADAQALLETYRAQIEQCEKLKVELDLIHDAINRTKREIAVLHGKSFDGNEMSKVTGELGAVVGGTEEATQQILEAAEAIDQAATAMTKVNSPDQQKLLTEEISERVVSIFEACNFQDLTGQRISKVMSTMKFIENHITVMMDIWGGVDAIRAHAPAIVDEREGDAKLLNGPKLDGDEGHASQNDIDALFD
jgi:chemotaxis protein CheZ